MTWFNNHVSRLNAAIETLDESKIEFVAREIHRAVKNGIPILTCGNGGSAAIADHMAADWTKNISKFVYPTRAPLVHSLCGNAALLTALANDDGYENVFSYQIKAWRNRLTLPRAFVLVVSASGDSLNVLNALKAAQEANFETFAFVGFDGGEILRKELASTIVHVKNYNYGVVEDVHSIIMHSLVERVTALLFNENKPS